LIAAVTVSVGTTPPLAPVLVAALNSVVHPLPLEEFTHAASTFPSVFSTYCQAKQPARHIQQRQRPKTQRKTTRTGAG
jgi:hypothetical protein